jgi:diguanylate cyclase (GGDEF)-like protein
VLRDHITIAIVAPVQPEDFFDLLWQGVWEATFDLSSFGVEVQNLTTRDENVGDQRRILEALSDSGLDAIGIVPFHLNALDDLIDRHVDRGTPVITFHADAPGSRRAAFVGPDSRLSGALAGEVIAKVMGRSGRILSFPGSLNEFHLAERYLGFRQTIAHYPRIAESCSSWPAPELPASAPRIAGCFVGCESLPAIAEWLEKQVSPIPCIGFGNTDRVRSLLESGAISAVIDENRYQMGYFAVQKAYEAVLKRDAHATLAGVQIPSTVVFSGNASAHEDALGGAFELLVRQRTEVLVSYKQRLEEANRKLLDLATTDPLTGLSNRRKFEEVLDQEVARAQRYGPVSLLLIDLDYFKQVNDRYGHQAGDEVLKTVGDVLRACCRATDVCARLGGDEFAVILPHSDPSSAAIVRRRILRQIGRTRVATSQGPVAIGLSIGAATLSNEIQNPEELIAAADGAMYEAKHAGRAAPFEEPGRYVAQH